MAVLRQSRTILITFLNWLTHKCTTHCLRTLLVFCLLMKRWMNLLTLQADGWLLLLKDHTEHSRFISTAHWKPHVKLKSWLATQWIALHLPPSLTTEATASSLFVPPQLLQFWLRSKLFFKSQAVKFILLFNFSLKQWLKTLSRNILSSNCHFGHRTTCSYQAARCQFPLHWPFALNLNHYSPHPTGILIITLLLNIFSEHCPSPAF